MRKHMNKILAVMLAGVMALGLCGCGSSNSGSEAGSEAQATQSQASGDKVYKIGICQLVQHKALDAATKGFKEALIDELGKDKVKFDEQNAAGDSAMCTTITNQFVSDGDDLILANATASLQAAAAATDTIPILGTAVTDYATALDLSDWSGTTGRNISGTSDLAPLDQQADLLHEMFPDAKNVGILYCSAEPNSVYQAKKIEESLSKYGYKCTEYSFADSNDVASVTTSACSGSDVLYVPTDNTAASCTEIIKNIAVPAKKPIIAGEEGICSGCGVATLSISYYDLGYETGKMAAEILTKGTDVSTMEVQSAPKVTKEYNKDICNELGIKVPDGYTAIAQ